MKKNDKITFSISVIAILCSLAALFLHVRSNHLANQALNTSKESNKYAKEALEASKFFFLNEQRPYLVIQPVKYPDRKEYFFIIEDTDGFHSFFQLELKNIGNSPAKNIFIPPILFIEGGTIKIDPPELITLAPQEKTYLLAHYVIELQDQQTPDFKNGFNLQVTISYQDNISNDHTYKTSIHYRIRQNSAQLIKSEMH